MADTQQRPVLTLEEEITNYLSHCATDNLDASRTLASMPDIIKRIMKDLRPLNLARGQLHILEKNEKVIPDSKNEIEYLKKFISAAEDQIKKRYYKEEIKGT